MARKDTNNYAPFTNQDLSTGFDTIAKPTSVNFHDNIGILVNWTGVPVGVLQVYVSNVNSAGGQKPNNISQYELLDFGSPINIDSTNTNHLISIHQIPFAWIAFKYIATSGSGMGSAIMVTKQVGG